MKLRNLWIVVTTVWVNVGFAGVAAVPLPERLLPSDTMAVLVVPDCGAAANAWGQHPFRQFWQDEAMGPFREKLAGKIREEFLGPVEGELGMTFAELRGLVKGQLALGLVQNGWPERRDRMPGLIIVADAGDQSGRMSELMTGWRKKWEEGGRPVKTETIREREFMVLGLGGAGREGVEILVGQSDTLLVVSTERRSLEQVLARQAGAGDGSLGEKPEFAGDYAAGLGDAHGYGWVNLRPIVGLVNQLAREQEASGSGTVAVLQPTKLLPAVGIDGLRSVSFRVRLGADGTAGEFRIGLPEAERVGLMKLLVPEMKDARPPEFVPGDTSRFQRVRLDLGKAWGTFEDVVFSILPTARGVVDMMLQSVGKDKDPNFDLRRELFGNLGDDVIVVEKAPDTNTLATLGSPPSLILLGSPAPDKVAGALKALTSLLPPPLSDLEEREVDGHRVYGLRFPQTGGDGGVPPVLGFAAGRGYLAISMEPEMLEGFVRGKPDGGALLRELPGLSVAAGKVGGMGNGFFGYENDRLTARATMEALRNDAGLLEQLLAMTPAGEHLDGEEGRRLKDWLDFSLLPSFDQVEKYFHFTVYGIEVGPEAVRYNVFSPTPPGLAR